MKRNILITGGAGFIDSQVVSIKLNNQDYVGYVKSGDYERYY